MALTRNGRIATGIAAGAIVLAAAFVGGALRDGGTEVATAADPTPDNVIPIPEDADADSGTAPDGAEDLDATSSDSDDASDPAAGGDSGSDTDGDDATTDDATTDDATTDDATTDDTTTDDTASVTVIDSDDLEGPAPTPTASSTNGAGIDADSADTTTGDADESTDTGTTDTGATDEASSSADDTTTTTEAATPVPTATPASTAETTSSGDSTSGEVLGTGGGVDTAECALDRLIIYAGARRGGVAGAIRNELARAGFGVGCATPVTVLASNCPLQFSGVLGPNSGYDPMLSFVASSDAVDRDTMTRVLANIGYSGAEINILDFGFVNADRPGEQWIAIFVPPSFDGWQELAGRAGLSPTTSSLCSASGQLVG